MTICAVIPALDEEGNIREVVEGIARFVDHVVVVDNGSRDRTAEIAEEAGAIVVRERQRGYGRACLAGMLRAKQEGADVILFLDGDGSDDPADAAALLEPIVHGRAELVLGYRDRSRVEPGAMTAVQRFGNWLAPALLRVTLGARYRDMPPFKAARLDALEALGLEDTGHGFTIELLIKAHNARLRVLEVPVACRKRRAGESKVSGTVIGAGRASAKIMSTIARYSLFR